MSQKVLLAEDSPTIQKVIKITLANQPYELIECATEAELTSKMNEIKPSLVLLDFNLSDKYTGYELCSKIKAISPSTSVLMLLGAFDNVDEEALEKCGASGKVVKPFDSNKFISICRRLTEEDKSAVEFPKVDLDKTAEHQISSDEDQWEVSHNFEETAPVEEVLVQATTVLNPLDQEVSNWAMAVPGIIGDNDLEHQEFPPVIAKTKPVPSLVVREEDNIDNKSPEASDLEYPTIEELTQTNSTKLVSIDSLTSTDEFEIEHGINSVEESDVSKIEELIKDEVETDLWKVDEYTEQKDEDSTKPDVFKPTITDFDESLFKPIEDSDTITWNVSENVNESSIKKDLNLVAQVNKTTVDDLRPEIEAMVQKYVKEYMDNMFQKQIEKISWEVIPDLAENLIRQELSKISNKILNDSN